MIEFAWRSVCGGRCIFPCNRLLNCHLWDDNYVGYWKWTFFIGAEFLVLTFFDTFLEDYNWVVSFVLLFFRLTWVSSLYYVYFFCPGFHFWDSWIKLISHVNKLRNGPDNTSPVSTLLRPSRDPTALSEVLSWALGWDWVLLR